MQDKYLNDALNLAEEIQDLIVKYAHNGLCKDAILGSLTAVYGRVSGLWLMKKEYLLHQDTIACIFENYEIGVKAAQEVILENKKSVDLKLIIIYP